MTKRTGKYITTSTVRVPNMVAGRLIPIFPISVFPSHVEDVENWMLTRKNPHNIHNPGCGFHAFRILKKDFGKRYTT